MDNKSINGNEGNSDISTGDDTYNDPDEKSDDEFDAFFDTLENDTDSAPETHINSDNVDPEGVNVDVSGIEEVESDTIKHNDDDGDDNTTNAIDVTTNDSDDTITNVTDANANISQ